MPARSCPSWGIDRPTQPWWFVSWVAAGQLTNVKSGRRRDLQALLAEFLQYAFAQKIGIALADKLMGAA
jgi:hypothetical protein